MTNEMIKYSQFFQYIYDVQRIILYSVRQICVYSKAKSKPHISTFELLYKNEGQREIEGVCVMRVRKREGVCMCVCVRERECKFGG